MEKKFRAAIGEVMSDDERYTWACAYAVAHATGISAEEAALIADNAITELRAEMNRRGAR